MKIVVSPAAEADLANIYDYGYAILDERQAAAYVDTLVARFKWLTLNRALRRRREDLLPGLFGRTEGVHLIVFRDGGDRIQIVRVPNQRMDPARHI